MVCITDRQKDKLVTLSKNAINKSRQNKTNSANVHVVHKTLKFNRLKSHYNEALRTPIVDTPTLRVVRNR